MDSFYLMPMSENEPDNSDILHPTRKRETITGFQSASWTIEEDNLLRILMNEIPHKKRWVTMSAHFENKTPQQIMNRWNKVLNPKLIKGNWTKEEDEILTNWVHEHGENGWTKIAAQLPGRIGKQCRERWTNCLKPNIKKTNWTEEEDDLIIKLQAKIGNKWAKMAEFLHGRTDNQIKNRWNSVLKKKASLPKVSQFHEIENPIYQFESRPFCSNPIDMDLMFDTNPSFIFNQTGDLYSSDWIGTDFEENWIEKDR